MTRSHRKIGVLVVNFGEPDEPTLERVRPYLERIFLQNVDLEHHRAVAATARARELATARAPGLVAEYRAIGGSPLNAQADAQAVALERALERSGWRVATYSAFQFTAPSIADRVAEARDDGVEHLIVLPVYPLCGQSTTVAALRRAREAANALDWSPRLDYVAGWHHHSDYLSLRVDGIRAFADERGLDLTDSDTLLYFSVHGTPVKYLDEGNRYDRYVEEHTREIAGFLGVEDRYAVGFQNHTNRNVEWTQPDNEDRIATISERRLVVAPIAFMHEQSETLAELDRELRAFVEGLGKEYHRVPVPHDDPRFTDFLAELVALVASGPAPADRARAACRCSPIADTWCTNGGRDLPPSPYAPKPA
jgi:ferrochelatase